MKRVIFHLSLFILVFCLLIVVLFIYIKPTAELNLDYEQVNVEQKIKEMVMQLKNETILTEQDIEALIKSQLDPQLDNDLIIEGAKFYLQNNELHATLYVKWKGKVDAELQALYAFSWDEPTISLTPISLHMKEIPLPNSWLEPIQFKLYEANQSLVKIASIENVNRELVIRWKLDIF